MSHKYLGDQFDIHTGGIDHINIHHNNEIAQSSVGYGKLPARYWLHVNHIMLNGEKISKSIGNVVYLDELELRNIKPIVFRYWYLTSNYDSSSNFTWESLESSKVAYEKIVNQLTNISEVGKIDKGYYKKALEHLNDNLNTALAISVIWQILKDDDLNDGDKKATVLEIDKILGLDFLNYEVNKIEIPKDVIDLAEERKKVREDKNYEESDRLRDLIKDKGYVISDTDNGYSLDKVN
jgi:cysteinyl-tRNA synthetase